MAIVFEDVTAEIAPPSAPAETAPTQQAQASHDPLETMRHALALMAERQARLHAD
ncbi:MULTISPECIES: hypothetical protein [unclassified Variovorax]|uniref:hypothetical protein n=1 Tax=unclassified Variovorax TaxID=663243 RepID=UPI001BD6A9C1|nr:MULTISPECIES: hypothetical protein [unclassified Variovorax]